MLWLLEEDGVGSAVSWGGASWYVVSHSLFARRCSTSLLSSFSLRHRILSSCSAKKDALRQTNEISD